MRLTKRQWEYLERAASDSGLLVYGCQEANIAERLLQRGLIRISCYGDKYFATERGWLAAKHHHLTTTLSSQHLSTTGE